MYLLVLLALVVGYIGLYYYYEKNRKIKDLKGKIVLITGGGGGIGKELVLQFRALGAKVVVWDINDEGLAELGKLSNVFTFVVDVTKKQEVYAIAKCVVQEVGHVEILVNNAGVVSGNSLLSSKDEALERTLQVNTISNFWTIKAFLPKMMEKNYGHIVTVSSVLGIFGGGRLTDYCASKFATFGLTECLRLELKASKSDVKTTLVCPFQVDTGMFAGVTLPGWVRLLFPLLKPKFVAEKIVEGVQKDKEVVVIPPVFWAVLLLRFVLPVALFDKVGAILGAMDGMDTFKGHAGATTTTPQEKEK